MLKLYSYFRSSASFRVRIALHYKELPFEYVPVHLTRDGGEQHSEEYRKINPMRHVPALVHDGFVLAESMAIIQYLEDVYPQKKLLPTNPKERAAVIQLSEVVNSGIQPLQNLKIIKYMEETYGLDRTEADAFTRHWIDQGLDSLERLLAKTAGKHSFGDTLSLADCFIIPQCTTAQRFGVQIENFAHLARVRDNGMLVPAVQKSLPDRQPDAHV